MSNASCIFTFLFPITVSPNSSCAGITIFLFFNVNTKSPFGILNQFTLCVLYACPFAQRFTISIFFIQLSGTSDISWINSGKSNKSP